MTLAELGIEGALEAPNTPEEREMLAVSSIEVSDFMNNPRDVGLIPANDVDKYLVSPEFGEKEAELFSRLGRLVAKQHIGRDPRTKLVKQDRTEFGDTVYSIITKASPLGKSTVKSLIRVESLFVVGHSHTISSRGTRRQITDIAPLLARDVNEFSIAAYKASRCS